jgi:DNA-directed RNA polymerase specialized sigma24 family protein
MKRWLEMRRLRRAIRHLPRVEREIFLALRFDEALTYDELGARLGITAAMVELLFARALGNFMSNLDRQRRWWRRW